MLALDGSLHALVSIERSQGRTISKLTLRLEPALLVRNVDLIFSINGQPNL
jgi:hypothetical protein